MCTMHFTALTMTLNQKYILAESMVIRNGYKAFQDLAMPDML